jgi:hypothetical protein
MMTRCLTLAAALLAAATPVAGADKKLAVHEWGVFRVHEDAEMANADLAALWNNLPEFVYGSIKGRAVPQHWGAAEIRDRPVLFFHAEQPMQFRLTVRFPGGAAGVWWPGTESPAVFGQQKQPPPGQTLSWVLAVKQPPQGWFPKTPAPPAAPEGHWFNRLREVKADEVFARFGPGGNHIEREKFVYYDGIFPQGKWLKFDVARDGVSVTNRVKHPVFDVTVIDRRGEGKVRIARIEKLDAGQVGRDIKFTNLDASHFISEAGTTLTKQLAAAGLNEDEAKSLVDLWKKEMFETPGLHAFYRIPQEEYDRLLPLKIEPKADEVVRVGLIFHAHLEPNLPATVHDLVKLLDAPKFAVRDGARKKLLAIGPAALVHLQRLKAKDLSTEVQQQVEALMKQWSTKSALE